MDFSDSDSMDSDASGLRQRILDPIPEESDGATSINESESIRNTVQRQNSNGRRKRGSRNHSNNHRTSPNSTISSTTTNSSSSSSTTDGSNRPMIFACFFVAVSVVTMTSDRRWKAFVTSLTGQEYVEEPQWWESAVIYEVYPRSFYDSDSDGMGDIQGITEKLGYLDDLDIDVLCLLPIYKSAMLDHGYDVKSFTEVDPALGTLEDFQMLIQEAHKLRIHVILDFIPNHTSELHPWFRSSRSDRDGPHANYYVWADGRNTGGDTNQPPNNWVSVHGDSMWEWDDQRTQYYLHQFHHFQPDLNWRHHKVHEEIENALLFWLNLGVDGFRFHGVKHLYEAQNLNRLERTSKLPHTHTDKYDHYTHTHTTHQPEVHSVLYKWKQLLENYGHEHGKKIFFSLDVPGDHPSEVTDYYSSGMPVNINLQKLNSSCDGICLARLVSQWIRRVPSGSPANWKIGGVYEGRISSKLSRDYSGAMNAISVLLPGTSWVYYGEELAMGPLIDEQQGSHRLPMKSCGLMQWTEEPNAGFSKTYEEPWLPIHPDYRRDNVAVQSQDEHSHLSIFKQLVSLRHEKSIYMGEFDLAIITNSIFSFIRYHKGQTGYLVTVNMGTEETTDDYTRYAGRFLPQRKFIPQKGYVVINTHAHKGLEPEIGSHVQLRDLMLYPAQALVIRFWPSY